MKFKNIFSFVIISLISFTGFAQQSIIGNFSSLGGQKVKLVGFHDFSTYTIDSIIVSENGKFTLKYGEKDLGMGYLAGEDDRAYFVVLTTEDIALEGLSFSLPKTVTTLAGKENKLFAQYASEHPRREQALSAWDYLGKIYKNDSIFAVNSRTRNDIEVEKHRIKSEDNLFIESLDEHSYLRWYLPLRKLVSSVSTIAQNQSEEIHNALSAFRNIDYTDLRLYKSGLLSESIDSHFWLIENSGKPSETLFDEMNISIDFILEKLKSNSENLNKITNHLFKLLEKRSLFKPAEYLALKILNESTYSITEDLAGQLESYRTMKIGNIAPDFEFNGDVFAPAYTSEKLPKRLSNLKSNYTVLIFGSSWCPACPQDLMEIAKIYKKWSKYNVEVIFVSLDDDDELFKKFSKPFPFISITDYQKWESPIVKSYHVLATPTIYLLNNKREILLRPNSVKQLDSWVNWYLVEGNK